MPTLAPADANKQVHYQGSVDEVRKACEGLHGLDKQAEKVKKIFLAGWIVSLVVAPIAFIAEAPGVGIGAGVAFVVFLIGHLMTRRHDIEDRKLEVARTVLDTFAPELDPKKPVELEMDFRGYWKADEGVTWMQMKLPLENGVSLTVGASTTFKRKKRAKRKYTKIKDKVAEVVTLQFKPPKGETFDPAAQGRMKKVRLQGLALRGVKMSAKGATFTMMTPQMIRMHGRAGWENGGLSHGIDGRMVVGSIITSYRLLAQAGASSDASAGAAATT